MSSVQLTTSSEERMNMYENMVEDLVNSDESSRYMLDGKTSWHSIKSRFRPTRFQFLPLDRRFVLVSQFIALNSLLMMIKHDSSLSSWEIFIDTRWSKNNKKKAISNNKFRLLFSFELENVCFVAICECGNKRNHEIVCRFKSAELEANRNEPWNFN